MRLPASTGVAALRVLAASQLVIHGTFRVFDGGVVPFGGFLESRGFPFGVALAGTLTAVEIVGGSLLVAGRWVRPLAAWFVGQLVTGIVLVHFPEGWFVVGGGRNGMEYSVVLIGCLAIVALCSQPGNPSSA